MESSTVGMDGDLTTAESIMNNLTDTPYNATPSSNMTAPSQVPAGQSMVILVISLIIDITGLLGNAFVIFVIVKTKSLRARLPNQFIVNQSVIDFCSCITLIASVFPKKAILTDSLADALYCKLYLSNSLSWGLVFSSTYSLIALTIERYLSIAHSVWHKLWFTKGKAYFIMTLTWIFGLVEGIAHAVPTSFVDENGACYTFTRWPNNGVRIMAGLITVMLHYILPMAVLIFCYGKMILVITGRIKKVNPVKEEVQKQGNALQAENAAQPQGNKTGDKKQDQLWTKAKRNVIHALTLVSVLFALCWSMNQIYYLMMCLGYPADFTSVFYNITVLAIFLNSSVNPIVYFVKYDQMKHAASVLLGCTAKINDHNFVTTVKPSSAAN